MKREMLSINSKPYGHSTDMELPSHYVHVHIHVYTIREIERGGATHTRQ